ncbi:MAG: histidine phosphatase family protein [Hyphomonadaceae bacterium]|nr:MAG: phosphohistidine phosphatase [Caulobacteraceae bacterium]MBT9447649.1 histidine phosphatase family protein [Hyphomonadaceae bacterium]TPW07225.1 MAG: phosphohistidine phosphatase [Alphaproteobacteria bacterium]
MPTLILMRHAKAVRDNEAPSDRARGLTQRGRREAAEAAAAMRDQGVRPSVVRASNAVRTVETAEIVIGAIAPEVEARFADALYLAEAGVIWADATRVATDAQGAVLTIGHNPGLHELVMRLVERSGERSALARCFLDDMPTASWIAFEVEGGELDSSGARVIGGWAPGREV